VPTLKITLLTTSTTLPALLISLAETALTLGGRLEHFGVNALKVKVYQPARSGFATLKAHQQRA
jgi:hypothetical protein